MSIIQKYSWLIILLATALGFIWPPLGQWSRPHLTTLLIIVMTLSCLHIDISKIGQVKRQASTYAIILLLIFALPAALISLFRSFLPAEAYVGLILAAAAPSAVSVVTLSSILGGTPIKALFSTTLAHLISPIVTPLVVWIFAHQVVTIDFWSMFILIAKIVILPLVIAQILRALKIHQIISNQLCTLLNLGFLILLITGIIAPSRGLVLANLNLVLTMSFIIVIVIAIQMLIDRFIAKNKRDATTWMIVDVYKNFTLSSVLALQFFGPIAVLGSIVFIVVNNLAIWPIQFFASRVNFSKPVQKRLKKGRF